MKDPQAPAHFIHLISKLLLVMVAIYLAINVCVVSTCVNSGIGSCALLRSFPPFDFIPAINRLVNFLILCGYPDLATLVSEIYSFAWFTGLIALITMVALAFFLGLRTSEEERARTRQLITVEATNAAAAASVAPGAGPEKKIGALGLAFISVVTLVIFLYVFWGFDTWSADSDRVQELIPDLLQMSIAWSGLLFMSMFYIIVAIERFGLPPPRKS
jgi:hypothetical protein